MKNPYFSAISRPKLDLLDSLIDDILPNLLTIKHVQCNVTHLR